VFNNYEARKEAAHKLMSNHLKVIADIVRADGPPVSQKNLVRLPRKEHQVDACIYEVTRRLSGGRPDPRDRLLTTKSAAQAATWVATCEYLIARIHSSPEEMENTPGFKQRNPKPVDTAAALASGSTTRPPLPQPRARALPASWPVAPAPSKPPASPQGPPRDSEDLRPNPLTGKPDMSSGAAAVMKAVLAEVAAEQQRLRWDRFSELLEDTQGAHG